MELSDSLGVITWIDNRACLPFTSLLITLCCLVRLDHVPVSYYMNLLLSNLIQLVILVALPRHPGLYWRYFASFYIYTWCAMVSLCFRMIIALERCFSFSCPLSNCITQTKGFVIVSVLVWVFCFVFVFLFLAFHEELSYLIFALLPVPVFIVCLLWTLLSIHLNISVSVNETCRTVRILVALVIQYFVTIFPTVIRSMFFKSFPLYGRWRSLSNIPHIYLTLFLLSYFMDLILFVFMCRGFMDKLFMLLCCCRIENPAGNDSSRASV